MESSIWVPMIVMPVRNAVPALAPTSATASSEATRCGDSATSVSASPATTMEMPKSRLRGIRWASLGAAAIPVPRPRNTATNSRPNAADPASRLNA